MASLAERLKRKKAVVSVMGLGYVGLPLAVEFAKAGFKTIGFDVDAEKVKKINQGISYITDVSGAELNRAVRSNRLIATTDFSLLSEVDAVSICVPTPLRKTKDPDISYIVEATMSVKRHLHRNMLIVLESTTYPGTTNEVLLPEFESAGLKVGRDFYLAFSPERIDPGNKKYTTRNIPKVIGGVTTACLKMARLLYSHVVDRIVPVSSTQAAEMVKILENTFRAVNIGLVNEIAIMCDKLGIDTWEVIEAAATKPFGFMRFNPGPGLGGHCIPVDPHYLAWKLKGLNYTARFIELASEVNSHMPDFVVEKIAQALNEERKCLNGSKILILGITYKKDVSDYRESPALDIIRLLRRRGAQVRYHDPFVPVLEIDGLKVESVNLGGKLKLSRLADYDCVVIVTDHSCYDFAAIVRHSNLIFDARNATASVKPARSQLRARIVKL